VDMDPRSFTRTCSIFSSCARRKSSWATPETRSPATYVRDWRFSLRAYSSDDRGVLMVEQEYRIVPRSSFGSYTPESPAVLAGLWRYKRYRATVEQHHLIADAVGQMGICYAVGSYQRVPEASQKSAWKESKRSRPQSRPCDRGAGHLRSTWPQAWF
jgi:hypothetical protein